MGRHVREAISVERCSKEMRGTFISTTSFDIQDTQTSMAMQELLFVISALSLVTCPLLATKRSWIGSIVTSDSSVQKLISRLAR